MPLVGWAVPTFHVGTSALMFFVLLLVNRKLMTPVSARCIESVMCSMMVCSYFLGREMRTVELTGQPADVSTLLTVIVTVVTLGILCV